MRAMVGGTSPVGTTGNSPAIHRWDIGKQIRPSPAGRKKSLQIALHIFHPVLFQKHLNLFLERHLPMMLGLALDVFRRVLDAGDTDAERAVTLLPLEFPMLLERVVNPF